MGNSGQTKKIRKLIEMWTVKILDGKEDSVGIWTKAKWYKRTGLYYVFPGTAWKNEHKVMV